MGRLERLADELEIPMLSVVGISPGHQNSPGSVPAHTQHRSSLCNDADFNHWYNDHCHDVSSTVGLGWFALK